MRRTHDDDHIRRVPLDARHTIRPSRVFEALRDRAVAAQMGHTLPRPPHMDDGSPPAAS